ncbi:DUF5134 domain-containing protein [Nocardia sp. NPDC050712]|uniref:DUF5134 domain-containing protein n=1 Tax=Nocardia sp. NPDC050712 TaxID=3155518 RepID=UPI003411E404
MTHFVQEYVVLRWLVVAAFLLASAIVIGRLAAPVRRPAGVGAGPGDSRGSERVVIRGGVRNRAGDELEQLLAPGDSRAPDRVVPTARAAQHESDAAHLLMCLVMLAMLMFPAGAKPEALRGVLVAMTVVFAILLVTRIAEGRSGSRDRVVAIGYHVVAAAAMLYAMSGHSESGHTGPAPVVAFGLAALFLADAVAVLVTGGRHWLGHPAGPVLTSALVPHVVMNLGTAYMLVGAVLV